MTTPVLRADDPMSRSGAVWCEDHGRWECSGKSKRSQERCHGVAISGMPRCRIHGGRSSAVLKAIGEANLLAWSTEVVDESAPVLDLGRVVMDQLRLAVMRADLVGLLVREQLAVDHDHGLIGTTYTAGRDGARVETGEQARGLVKLEAEWRDRVVRFAKTAHDMGIAETHVQLEQERAQLVTAAFLAALEVGGLVPEVRSLMIERFLEGLGSAVVGEVVES